MKKLYLCALMLLIGMLVNNLYSQEFSDHIRIDQFGYRPAATKTAVIRYPKVGFDAVDTEFVPGFVYSVVNAETREVVYSGEIVSFANGEVDESSGDIVWWFDFSELSHPGRYYIWDETNNIRSHYFSIAEDVYNDLLRHAVRMFYYQRVGCEKSVQHAGADWADGASHLGPLQDSECRLYSAKDDPSTSRDLRGGWFDAGDFNKYTIWTANYIESLLLAYIENPQVFTDDYNIPESGNGIPDLLDEVKWGMDWVLRMQEEDGSVLCIQSLDHASPPSSAIGQSVYGPATTMASYSAAKAFILGYKVFGDIGMSDYADTLKSAAISAWRWAENNPDVLFKNNDSESGTKGVGAGQQEISEDYDRLMVKMLAAMYMFEYIGDDEYKTALESEYETLPLFIWSNFVQQYWFEDQMLGMRIQGMDGVDETMKTKFFNALVKGFSKEKDYVGKIGKDGYRSFLYKYAWGSNSYKSSYGLTFLEMQKRNLFPDLSDKFTSVAEDYLHYIHGVNPLGLVYLTNMNKYGASVSITEIYHSWFDANSSIWDAVTETTPGPAPGYLAGGPNVSYTVASCCPDNCGSAANNKLCFAEDVPEGEPAQKMYKDFNTSWPLDSWELTEPSCSYQSHYIRLLANFVAAPQVADNTIVEPVSSFSVSVYPNPAKEQIFVRSTSPISKLMLYDSQMRLLKECSACTVVDVSALNKGIYFLKVDMAGVVITKKIIVNN